MDDSEEDSNWSNGPVFNLEEEQLSSDGSDESDDYEENREASDDEDMDMDIWDLKNDEGPSLVQNRIEKFVIEDPMWKVCLCL